MNSDDIIPLIGILIVVSIIGSAVGILCYERFVEEYPDRYEVEMDDGTVYLCNDYITTKEGITYLYHYPTEKYFSREKTEVFTHLIKGVKKI